MTTFEDPVSEPRPSAGTTAPSESLVPEVPDVREALIACFLDYAFQADEVRAYDVAAVWRRAADIASGMVVK